jgi:hypothetical protein
MNAGFGNKVWQKPRDVHMTSQKNSAQFPLRAVLAVLVLAASVLGNLYSGESEAQRYAYSDSRSTAAAAQALVQR